jgi:hypothetical protein
LGALREDLSESDPICSRIFCSMCWRSTAMCLPAAGSKIGTACWGRSSPEHQRDRSVTATTSWYAAQRSLRRHASPRSRASCRSAAAMMFTDQSSSRRWLKVKRTGREEFVVRAGPDRAAGRHLLRLTTARLLPCGWPAALRWAPRDGIQRREVPRCVDVSVSAIYKCHWGRASGGRGAFA